MLTATDLAAAAPAFRAGVRAGVNLAGYCPSRGGTGYRARRQYDRGYHAGKIARDAGQAGALVALLAREVVA